MLCNNESVIEEEGSRDQGHCQKVQSYDGVRYEHSVAHDGVGMERHAIAWTIALQTPDSAAIRVVLEDRGATIPAGEDMIEPTKGIAL